MQTTQPSGWKKAEIFPIIHRIIHMLCHAHLRYITHDEIRDALLIDDEALAIIQQALTHNTELSTLFVVSNMVAWFSKSITEQTSAYCAEFERTKIDGRWAYRSCDIVDTPPPPVGNEPRATFSEGGAFEITMTAYERNRQARAQCLAHYGAVCRICGFDFFQVFGEIGAGYIHVHHSVPISQRAGTYQLDPIRDLQPLCPNCHAMAHKRQPPFTVEELSAIRTAQRQKP